MESSKGIYPISPNRSPYRTTNIIPNDFPTSNQLNKFCRCINLGDPIALSGPIDSASGSVDLIERSEARFAPLLMSGSLQ